MMQDGKKNSISPRNRYRQKTRLCPLNSYDLNSLIEEVSSISKKMKVYDIDTGKQTIQSVVSISDFSLVIKRRYETVLLWIKKKKFPSPHFISVEGGRSKRLYSLKESVKFIKILHSVKEGFVGFGKYASYITRELFK